MDTAVVRLLRHVGAALLASGDATNRVANQLNDIASLYGVHRIRFAAFPTSIFIRRADPSGGTVDFAVTGGVSLRLDQIGRVKDFVARLKDTLPDPDEAVEDLEVLLIQPPRFPPAVIVLGGALLSLGLGMTRDPALIALPWLAALGALTAALQWAAGRLRLLSMVLPVASAVLVSYIVFSLPPVWIGGEPAVIVFASLVVLLPGAAFTIGLTELSSGATVSGASRIMLAGASLLVLTLGITGGFVAAGSPGPAPGGYHAGAWLGWVGLPVMAFGAYLYASARKGAVVGMIAVFAIAYALVQGSDVLFGPIVGAFLGGFVIVPLAYHAQKRWRGPAAQLTFLSAFWLIGPGTDIVTSSTRFFLPEAVPVEGPSAVAVWTAVMLGILTGSQVITTAAEKIRQIIRGTD
ncbi:threonine/serine exporter family protein [Salininema proteolyticum]|uniref:Threonine/serine exporter family protein n=1 Tax=Salininema proteolyticum TaxID=1607685 RepID=A0ABV8TYE0_9ACTN